MGGKSKYFWWEESTFLILSKIYKTAKDSELFCNFSIFSLKAPIFTNIFPVDWYHLQAYNIVHNIKIITFSVMSWFVVKICNFLRPTQTSILVAFTRISSFFFHIKHLIWEIPISEESYIFSPRMWEYLCCQLLRKRILFSWICLYNVDSWTNVGKERQKGWKGGSWDERGQKKAKTTRKMTEARTPAAK